MVPTFRKPNEIVFKMAALMAQNRNKKMFRIGTVLGFTCSDFKPQLYSDPHCIVKNPKIQIFSRRSFLGKCPENWLGVVRAGGARQGGGGGSAQESARVEWSG